MSRCWTSRHAGQLETRLSRSAAGLAATALTLGALVATGCGRSLFGPTGTTRTQFDRFDQARNALPSAEIENEFGRFEPNLRGRLSRGG